MLNQRESTGKRRRFILSWGLLVVAGLVAGLVGLATLSGSADGQAGKPATPTTLTVSGITNTSATLMWVAGTGGGCTATQYTVTLYQSDNLHLGATTAATLTRTVTDLRPGSDYEFSVVAEGDCGSSNSSPRKSFTTTGTALSPNPPSGFTVSSVTDTTAALSWTAGADGVCATTAHDVWVEPDLETVASNIWERQGHTTTTATVTGLSAGTKYRAFVDSYGSTCDKYSDWVMVRFTTSTVVATNTPTPEPTTVARPNAPTGLAASAITGTSATLSWTAGADGSCATTSYEVYVYLPPALDAEVQTLVWQRIRIIGTTVTVTGLLPETVYEPELFSRGDSCGNQSLSKTTKFTTTSLPLPAKPAGVTATGGVRQVALSWTNPNNVSITRWEYQQKTGTGNYGSWTAIGSSGASTTTHTVTGLANGTAYAFKVRAVNVTGNSPASDEVTATTTALPAKPAGVAATGGVRQVALSWTNPSDSTITSWQYQQKTGTGTYGTWTAIGSSSATTTRHTVTGLANGTAYAFKVRAVNPAGNGAASDEVTTTTTALPAKPAGVSATGGVRQVALSWTDPSNASITSWEYQQKTGAGSYGSWMAIGSSSATTTRHTVTGLTNGTSYGFKVRAVNPAGNGAASDEVTATTTALPAKPAGVAATGGVRQVALSWTDPSNASITSWQYQQKTGTGAYGTWTAIGSSSATTTRHTVTGLTAGTTYAFKIRAVNPAGNGVASDEVTAATAPAKPTGVTAAGGVKQATLTWTNPSYASITSWEYQRKAGSGSYGVWTAIPSSSATTITHTVTGLTDGTVYGFKVRAVNPAGNGVASDEVTAATAPAKPTGVTATGGLKRVTLSWANPSYTSITSWEYQQKTGTGNYGTWTAIPSSSATTTTYTVTGLSDATTYGFKVRAVNPAGNGVASDEVTARTAPAKPTGVSATAGAQRVVLAWADPGDASITRWEYQQKQGSGAYGLWTAISRSSATTTTYTVRGLLAETTYAFKVRAVNPAGNGVASDEVTATTPQFVLVPGEETATPTPTATPTGTPTATPTPPPGATPAPGSTPTPTPPPGDAPDTGAGDTDDDVPPEPDIGAGDRDGDEPAEPDTGDGDRDDDAPAEPDTGAGGDTTDDEPDIGDTGSGLATGASVSLAAITGVIALALALALGGPAWARRRR